MKIIKLVYIAHGWYLALTDKPLIQEHVEAWIYGPVISELYHEFKKYGNEPIREHATFFAALHDLPPYVERFLNKVWEVYKDFTAIQLSQMTHLPDTPWHTISAEISLDKKNPIIPDDLICEYYKKIANDQ